MPVVLGMQQELCQASVMPRRSPSTTPASSTKTHLLLLPRFWLPPPPHLPTGPSINPTGMKFHPFEMISQLRYYHDRPLRCASNKLHMLGYCCLVSDSTEVQQTALAALRTQPANLCRCVASRKCYLCCHTKSPILHTTLAFLAVDMANAKLASHCEESFSNAGL